MDEKKRIYTKTDFDRFSEELKAKYESVLAGQRARIDELKADLEKAEKTISDYAGQKDLIYKAITTALKKADEIERVSLLRYNQEIAQLKSFHDKWIGYYNKIIEAYPLDDDLIETSRVNGKIAAVLDKAGDIDAQYEKARGELKASVDSDDENTRAAIAAAKDERKDEYTDRSPAGFSFAEALHPKEDLKDIMKELGVLMDDGE